MLFIEKNVKWFTQSRFSCDFHGLDFFFFFFRTNKVLKTIHRKPDKCVTPAFLVTKKYTKYLGFVKATHFTHWLQSYQEIIAALIKILMEKPLNQINMKHFSSGVTLGYLNRLFFFFFKVTPAQQRSETHEDLTNNRKKSASWGLSADV